MDNDEATTTPERQRTTRAAPYTTRTNPPLRASPRQRTPSPAAQQHPARTPTRSSPRLQARTVTPGNHREQGELVISPEPVRAGERGPQPGQRYRLLVQPVVKATVSQRDSSGTFLDDFAVNGASFDEVMTKMWDHFRPHIKGRAAKVDGAWTMEPVASNQWARFFQFKYKNHLIPNARSTSMWERWLQSARGETTRLFIYEYGSALSKTADLTAFQTACIRPIETDRAGAVSDGGVREMAQRLQEQWGNRYEAEIVIWRMWANEIMRNLDRSTWQEAVQQPPPPRIIACLRAVDSRVEERLASLTRSGTMALDCVNATIADTAALRQAFQLLERRLDLHEQNLQTRKAIIEAFQREANPPPRDEIPDPVARMENIPDHDHAE